MANSLKSQGFTNVVMIGDSGGNLTPMKEVAEAVNSAWAGSRRAGPLHPGYYNYADVEAFEERELGIHETMEGLHDDYYISAIIATVDTDAIRMPERVKAGKFVINGVPLAPIEKTIANGKRMVEFRTQVTVAAIRKSMAK